MLTFISVMIFMYFAVEEVKAKWKNLRETYTRRKREEAEECRSGQAAKKKKPWKYMQIMGFLAASTEPRTHNGIHA